MTCFGFVTMFLKHFAPQCEKFFFLGTLEILGLSKGGTPVSCQKFQNLSKFPRFWDFSNLKNNHQKPFRQKKECRFRQEEVFFDPWVINWSHFQFKKALNKCVQRSVRMPCKGSSNTFCFFKNWFFFVERLNWVRTKLRMDWKMREDFFFLTRKRSVKIYHFEEVRLTLNSSSKLVTELQNQVNRGYLVCFVWFEKFIRWTMKSSTMWKVLRFLTMIKIKKLHKNQSTVQNKSLKHL